MLAMTSGVLSMPFDVKNVVEEFPVNTASNNLKTLDPTAPSLSEINILQHKNELYLFNTCILGDTNTHHSLFSMRKRG